jgi:type I restriction enzyme, R subunit
MDLLEKFQKMIEAYDAGSQNVDQFFEELLKFAQSLSEEEQRGIAEGLTEEELALFDLLTKPEPKHEEGEGGGQEGGARATGGAEGREAGAGPA